MVQAPNFDDGGGTLQGSAHDMVGQNGCVAGCTTTALGGWSSRSVVHSVAMKGVNLGFASVFIEIPAQRPSICRGFGLIISWECRALSPSFPIRWGFDFDLFPLRFRLVTTLPTGSAIRRGVGADPVLGRAREKSGQARLGRWGGFLPMANRKMKKAFFQIFSKFQTNLNSNQIYNFDDFHSHNKT
jgi:hypothetical protein